jgi:hypothetical protein
MRPRWHVDVAYTIVRSMTMCYLQADEAVRIDLGTISSAVSVRKALQLTEIAGVSGGMRDSIWKSQWNCLLNS